MLAAGLTGLTAAAGVVVEQEQREPGGDAVLARTVYYLDAGRLRIETRSEDGDEVVLIFQADKSVAWSINRNEGTYYELTPAKVAEMRQRLDKMQREMAARLAELPAEQRQAIEQMMEHMGQTMTSPPPATVRIVGREEQIGSFVCTRYEVLRGGQREAEIWTAPLEQLQLGGEEYATLAALARLFEPLGQRMPGPELGGLRTLEQSGEGLQGFPVRSLTYDEGRAIAEELVVRVEQQSFEANLFELPSGLRKAEIGEEW